MTTTVERGQGQVRGARRQARRAARPARRVGAAHPRRARLRPHQPARDRQQLRVHPRRRALLLRRQARADHLQRPLLQGPLRAPATTASSRTRPPPRSCSTRSRPSWSRPCRTRRPMHRLWYDLRTQSMFEAELPRGGPDHRQDARGDDLAGRQPLRRAGRAAAPRDPGGGVRDARRDLPAGAARPRGRTTPRPLPTAGRAVHRVMPLMLGETGGRRRLVLCHARTLLLT